jgi:hypothetical protein
VSPSPLGIAGHGQSFFLDSSGNLLSYSDSTGSHTWGKNGTAGFQSLSVGTDAQGNDEVSLLSSGALYKFDQGVWTNTGASGFSAMAAGQGETFVLFNGYLFIYIDGYGWYYSPYHGFSALSVGTDTKGRDEVSVLFNGGLFKYDQGTWSYPNGSGFTSVSAGVGGETFVFYNGYLFIWNDTSGWNYTPFSGFTQMSVGADNLGRDEVAVLFNGALFVYDQGNWSYPNGAFTSVVAGHQQTFALDASGALWRYQDLGSLVKLSATNFQQIVVGLDSAGNEELWLIASNNVLWRYNGTLTNLGVSASKLGDGIR